MHIYYFVSLEKQGGSGIEARFVHLGLGFIPLAGSHSFFLYSQRLLVGGECRDYSSKCNDIHLPSNYDLECCGLRSFLPMHSNGWWNPEVELDVTIQVAGGEIPFLWYALPSFKKKVKTVSQQGEKFLHSPLPSVKYLYLQEV